MSRLGEEEVEVVENEVAAHEAVNDAVAATICGLADSGARPPPDPDSGPKTRATTTTTIKTTQIAPPAATS
ncbi:MAG TPA: hypothetical protein VF337_08275 [Candidatus Limnocylindrales bacterium]